ncbi:MAG: NAD(P)H-dependent oxidoreductase [Spirochaetales bacterium]|nr:NAD(P)H-dependent oxidoreductase [Spirochaetales bacterium]
MHILIVFSHPNRESLNGAFLDKAIEGLKLNPEKVEVEVLDLYSDYFDPRLTFNEEKKRRDMYRDPAMEKYRQQILNADRIIFIYPIWWGRPPAILLGYFDQLLSSGFAYKNIPGKIMPEGLLKKKRVVCISTMKGPTGYPLLLLRNAHKVLMRKAIFNFVGIRDVRFFEFGGMEKKNGKQAEYLKRIKRYMLKLKSVA